MTKRMKNKKILLIVLSALMCLMLGIFSACKKPDDNPSTSTLDEVVRGTNGTEYTTEGVVYATASDGYFIYDDSGRVFVKDNDKYAVGDKLKVKGVLALDNKNAPTLAGTDVNKLSSGETTLQPAATTIKNLMSIGATKGSYYQYLTISGILSHSENVYSLTEGSNKIVFDTRSDSSALNDWLDKKVDVNVINTVYTNTWSCLYVGGIKEHAVELDAVKADVFANVESKLVRETWFSIDLPTSYALEPRIEFNWSVVEGGSAISIENNVATITEPDQTVAAKLKLVISVDGNSAEQVYDVTVKAANTVALKDAADAEAGVLIKTEGTVVAMGMAQVQDRIGLMLTDSEGNLLSVDLPALSEMEKYQLGDTVKVAGTYSAGNASIARFSARASVLISRDADYKVDYSTLPATTLETVEDYQALISDPFGNSNKLYKIVKPYLIYSGNSTYNFIRFGADAEHAPEGFNVTAAGETEAKSWYFCFARNALAFSAEGLEQKLNVPLLSNGAKQYEAYTIYAYAMYNGGSTWQFIVPDLNAVEIDYAAIAPEQIRAAFGSTFIMADTAGKLELPANTADISGITWTASRDGVIDCATGEYSALTETVSLTLTAHFTVNGQEFTVDIPVMFLSEAPEYLTVTEALSQSEGVINFLKGVVVGFGPNTGTGIPNGAQWGVYISDGVNVLYIPEGQFDRSSADTDFDKVYLLDDGHKIALGDELYFISSVRTGARLALGTSVTLNAENVDLNWQPNTENVTVLSSFADMKTFFSDESNLDKMVKFVGTPENPLYLGGSSSTYDKLNLKFYFGDIEGGVSSSSVKINDRTIAAKARSSEYSLGIKWWTVLNPNMSEAWVGTDTSYGFTGEIYAVWSSKAGTSYYQLALLSQGFTLKALTDDQIAKYEIIAAVPETVSAGEAGTLSLPTSTEHASEIVWTTESTLIDCTTGVYQAVTADTEVTLTATFKVGGNSHTTTVTIKLLAAQLKEYTVSELLAAAELPEVFALNATVYAFGTTSGSNEEQRNGLILSDGVNTLWYSEAVYEINGTALKRGDNVKISTPTLNKVGGKQELSGGTLEFVSENNAVSVENISLYATVSNEEEMVALANGMASPLSGVVVKFTGTFSFIGTGTNGATCRYQLHYKEPSSVTGSSDARYAFGDYTDASHGNRTFAFSSAGNAYSFPDWWTSCGMPAGSSKVSHPVTGTIYAVCCSYGATMYAWSIIAIDCAAVTA